MKNNTNEAKQNRTIKVEDGCVSSGELLGQSTTLKIRHGNNFYQLRKTKQQKLILTK